MSRTCYVLLWFDLETVEGAAKALENYRAHRVQATFGILEDAEPLDEAMLALWEDVIGRLYIEERKAPSHMKNDESLFGTGLNRYWDYTYNIKISWGPYLDGESIGLANCVVRCDIDIRDLQEDIEEAYIDTFAQLVERSGAVMGALTDEYAGPDDIDDVVVTFGKRPLMVFTRAILADSKARPMIDGVLGSLDDPPYRDTMTSNGSRVVQTLGYE